MRHAHEFSFNVYTVDKQSSSGGIIEIGSTSAAPPEPAHFQSPTRVNLP